MIQGENVLLRRLNHDDIPILWEFIYGEKDPEWKKWDAPYFPVGFMTRRDFEKEKKEKQKICIQIKCILKQTDALLEW